MKCLLYKVWKAVKKYFLYLFSDFLIANPSIKHIVIDTSLYIDSIFVSIGKNKSSYEIGIPKIGEMNLVKSKLCTERDFRQDWFKYWCELLGYKPTQLHRKTWEFVTITQALYERGMLEQGKKGLGFGVGKEPLPSLFASRCCDVLATDIDIETREGKLWKKTGDHISQLNDLYKEKICNSEKFRKHIQYQSLDMNNIPKILTDFDFTWSSCAFEHLGSIQNGINFILNQMNCLKQGGWAIHTTEFNLTSNDSTLENEDLVLFRRRDFENLIDTLYGKGHHIEELDTSVGLTRNDYYFDIPPCSKNQHLKLKIGEYISTSIILIVRK